MQETQEVETWIVCEAMCNTWFHIHCVGLDTDIVLFAQIARAVFESMSDRVRLNLSIIPGGGTRLCLTSGYLANDTIHK